MTTPGRSVEGPPACLRAHHPWSIREGLDTELAAAARALWRAYKYTLPHPPEELARVDLAAARSVRYDVDAYGRRLAWCQTCDAVTTHQTLTMALAWGQVHRCGEEDPS